MQRIGLQGNPVASDVGPLPLSANLVKPIVQQYRDPISMGRCRLFNNVAVGLPRRRSNRCMLTDSTSSHFGHDFVVTPLHTTNTLGSLCWVVLIATDKASFDDLFLIAHNSMLDIVSPVDDRDLSLEDQGRPA